MFLLILSIALVFINLIFRKSKICFSALLLDLWVLFGWSYGNADWIIYTNRYNNYIALSSRTEWLFTMLVKGGHILGLDYRGFLIIISAICLLLMAKTIWDYASEPGLPLALYAIFCFAIDVTQVRFFIAFAVACFALRFLFKFNEEKEKKQLIFFIATILVATSIHMATILMLVLLIPVFFSRKITIAITVGANVVFLLASSLSSKIFALIGMFLGETKAEFVMDQASKYDRGTVLYVWFKTLFIFAGFFAIYMCAKYFMQKYSEFAEDKKPYNKQLEFAMDCNIIILVVLGLITVTTDFYRIQQIIVFMNYLVYSNFLRSTTLGKVRLSNLVIVSVAVAFAFGALYNLVLSNPNYEVVFKPLFYNNVLLGS